MKFDELNLIPPLLRALKYEGYTDPTPIQGKALPIVLKGRDLIGCAQTGTGKTAVFAVPILQILNHEEKYRQCPRQIQALIITPTRELATQIDDSFDAYNRFLHLRHTVIIGGVNQYAQEKALRQGVDILIATPGRLLDLINQKIVALGHVKVFVLDEADQMLDMGFIHDVKKVVALLPAKRQSLFFSATMPPEVVKLAATILTDPVNVAISPASSTPDIVKQGVYFVDKPDKRGLLVHVLEEESIPSALVFVRTKYGADRLTDFLLRAGIQAEAIHGNRSQNQRQYTLSRFKKKQTRVLVATDVAARGIDIDTLSHVINFDIPNMPEMYIHRIGRTGRAGTAGTALSFCDRKERAYLNAIQRMLKRVIPVIVNHPYHMNISATRPYAPSASKQIHPAGHTAVTKSRASGSEGDKRRSNKRRWYGPRTRTSIREE
jgi:ATP-dependent RNA helicase RhlE